MANKKAFVRYANNKLVPASVFIGAKAPAVGVWKEIPYDLCCDAPICPQPNYGDWKLVTGGEAGDGVVLINDLGECPTYTFIGPNDDVDNGWVYLTKYFPSTTCLQIDYEWTSFDEGTVVDRPVYWLSSSKPTGIPGDLTPQVEGTPADGIWNITVPGGQWFAIGIYSTDSCCGRGFLSVEICEVECPGPIPPDGQIVGVLIGYQTISPVENIVLSNTQEDLCIFVNDALNDNIEAPVFDQTTYYYVSSNNTLYNLVTNSIAQDGYYVVVPAGVFQVINGLVVQVIQLNAELIEICNITTTTTTTELP